MGRASKAWEVRERENLGHIAKEGGLAAESCELLKEEMNFVLVFAASLHLRVFDVNELERQLEEKVFELVSTELQDLRRGVGTLSTW